MRKLEVSNCIDAENEFFVNILENGFDLVAKEDPFTNDYIEKLCSIKSNFFMNTPFIRNRMNSFLIEKDCFVSLAITVEVRND